jgi:hypothetical protein
VKEQEQDQSGAEINFESVDHIVISQLETVESNTVQPHRLIEIYQKLET